MTEMKKTQRDITKYRLAKSLKKLMVKKPLEKITIKDITLSAGFKRQTFYYHFRDINSLLWWTFSEDISHYYTENTNLKTWDEQIFRILEYMEKNRAFCVSALKGIGREPIKEMLITEVEIFIRERETNEKEAKISNEDINFLKHFLAGGIANILEEWLIGNVSMEKEDIVHYARIISDNISRDFNIPTTI